MPNLSESPLDRQDAQKAWREFIEKIHALTFNGNPLICRGQADKNWRLDPSISRIPEQFKRKQKGNPQGMDCSDDRLQRAVIKFEENQSQLFEDRLRVYADSRIPIPHDFREDRLKTWMGMQHFGFPTRLLDWTTNPYAAAYFAARDNPFDDGAIYIMKMATDFQPRTVRYEQILQDSLFVVPCLWTSMRSDRQDSVFTVCDSCLDDHRERIERLNHGHGYRCAIEEFHKVLVAERTKEEFMDRLEVMGISGKSLYPDFEGLAKYGNELLTKSMREAFLDDRKFGDV